MFPATLQVPFIVLTFSCNSKNNFWFCFFSKFQRRREVNVLRNSASQNNCYFPSFSFLFTQLRITKLRWLNWRFTLSKQWLRLRFALFLSASFIRNFERHTISVHCFVFLSVIFVCWAAAKRELQNKGV